MRRIEKFVWIAELRDGTRISQYPNGTKLGEEGKETSFRSVVKRKSRLKKLRLRSDEGKEFVVDFEKRKFVVNGKSYAPVLKKNAILEPLNMRRIRRTLDQFGNDISVEIDYILGWEVEQDGKKFRQFIEVKSDGTIDFKF